MEKYKSGESGIKRYENEVINVPSPKFGKVKKENIFEHGEWLNRLAPEHFAVIYATKRCIPTRFHDKLLFTPNYKAFCASLIPDHGKDIVPDARLVIPFYNEYNELIAVSGRALVTSDRTLRYITLRTKDNTDKLVYGLDRVDLTKPVKIVEGPIDSMFLNNCLASGDANLMLVAKDIDCAKKILIFDREPRNKEIVKMMQDDIVTNEKLIKYLIKNAHWSPLEMVSMCLGIETTRDIARQLLRHRSFSFQEFSQRYADPTAELDDAFVLREARLQDTKNRQNSIELDMSDEKQRLLAYEWERSQNRVLYAVKKEYEWAIKNGIAKEQARAVLPEGLTVSRLYMNGTLRSWIHYIQLRSANGTQKEHQEIALKCAEVIAKVFPMANELTQQK